HKSVTLDHPDRCPSSPERANPPASRAGRGGSTGRRNWNWNWKRPPLRNQHFHCAPVPVIVGWTPGAQVLAVAVANDEADVRCGARDLRLHGPAAVFRQPHIELGRSSPAGKSKKTDPGITTVQGTLNGWRADPG